MPGTAFRIGEAARRAGVSPDTLRYYERVGVLPVAARTAAGYRVYSDASVERIRFVRNALRFGFSLKQIAAFLRARESGHPPCLEVRAAASRLLDEMDRQIASMTDARAAIRATLEEWDERLAATRPGAAARHAGSSVRGDRGAEPFATASPLSSRVTLRLRNARAVLLQHAAEQYAFTPFLT